MNKILEVTLYIITAILFLMIGVAMMGIGKAEANQAYYQRELDKAVINATPSYQVTCTATEIKNYCTKTMMKVK